MLKILRSVLRSDRQLWRIWAYLWLVWFGAVPVLWSGRFLGFGNGLPGFGNDWLGIVMVLGFLAAPLFVPCVLTLQALFDCFDAMALRKRAATSKTATI